MFRRVIRSPFAIVVFLFVCAVAFIWTGVLDALIPDGVVNRWSMIASAGAWAIAAYLITRAVMLFQKSRHAFTGLGLGIAIALIVAEIGVRLLHPGSSAYEYRLWHSDAFHHITPPNREMYHGFDRDAREAIFVRTNVDGYRTQYTQASFKEYKTRIAVLGDSFTFGLFNRQEAANPHALEGLLRERLNRDDIAVLNAGVVSYSPFIGRFVIDESLRTYNPSHIIYLFDASDIGDDYEYERMADLDGGGSRFPRTVVTSIFRSGPSVLDHSALMQRLYTPYAFARAFLLHPLAMASSELNPMIVHGLEIDGVRQRDRYFIYRYPPEKTRPFFEKTLEHVTAMAEITRGMGAQFVFVVPPRYHHWNDAEAPKNWESYAYSNHEPHEFAYLEFFDEHRESVEYPILNLLPLFQENAENGPFVFYFDAHWNASGHKLVAKGIADFLIGEGLVK